MRLARAVSWVDLKATLSAEHALIVDCGLANLVLTMISTLIPLAEASARFFTKRRLLRHSIS